MEKLSTYIRPINRNKFLIKVLPLMIIYFVLLADDFFYHIPLNQIIVGVLEVISIILMVWLFTGRLMDLGRSGWQLLLLFVPGYNFYLLFMMLFRRGTSDIDG